MLSAGFDLAVSVDRLNTKDVANFDWLLWRRQLQESIVFESLASPSYEGAQPPSGEVDRQGESLSAPDLHADFATELETEVAWIHEKLKAREASLGFVRGRSSRRF